MAQSNFLAVGVHGEAQPKIWMQERRRVGNVESMTGVVWFVHGKVVLLRATPEQLRPVTAAERFLGELQNTNLDVFTQVVDNPRT